MFIDPSDISKQLGYTFKDEKILQASLTHASIAGSRLDSNERLEFLGDAILGYVVSEYLFETFPTYLEGELTKIKSAVVSRRACARISDELKLVWLLNMGKGMCDNRANLPSSIAACVLESIIAAIYMDGGIRAARRFILKHFKPLIAEASRSTHQENYKSALQHFAQKFLPTNPTYVVLDEKGPDHSKAFEVCVEIDSHRFPGAWANSKKEAEQNAALNALRELNLVRTNADHGGIEILDKPPQDMPMRRKKRKHRGDRGDGSDGGDGGDSGAKAGQEPTPAETDAGDPSADAQRPAESESSDPVQQPGPDAPPDPGDNHSQSEEVERRVIFD